ncbi:DUF4229 domain-containing protein [Kitasatospora sp. RB6PN24]|uniref:DUF4229 domain-containing protein n=1 Tax=Kitasatospora humi TaxID=2893891 RepID=UPI001E38FED1|nr:DUF4229 domain-containing protein [Kitasatospora humi]MCC9306731.1 DUF4229 domain-containing protein [Kitasatospora humi]
MSSKKHATLRYTSLRASIFLACLLVFALLGHFGVIPVTGSLGSILLLMLAVIASAPISYVLLSKQRDDMSEQIVTGVSSLKNRAKQRIAEQNAEEDAADEAARAAAGQQ